MNEYEAIPTKHYIFSDNDFRVVEFENNIWVSIYDLQVAFGKAIRGLCKGKNYAKSIYIYNNDMGRWLHFIKINALDDVADNYNPSPVESASNIIKCQIRRLREHILTDMPDVVEEEERHLTKELNPPVDKYKISDCFENDFFDFIIPINKQSHLNNCIVLSIDINKKYKSGKTYTFRIGNGVYRRFGQYDRVAVGKNNKGVIAIKKHEQGYRLYKDFEKKGEAEYKGKVTLKICRDIGLNGYEGKYEKGLTVKDGLILIDTNVTR